MGARVFIATACLAALLVGPAGAFTGRHAGQRLTQQPRISSHGPLAMTATHGRRQALFTAASMPAIFLAQVPVASAANGESKANQLLASFGCSPLKSTNGYIQLAEFVGRAGAANIDGTKTRGFNLKSPLLVAFNYPQTWVTALPTISSNGESGTVSAGNYIKGDSSSFVALDARGARTTSDLSKDVLTQAVVSSATGDVYQDVKIKKVVPREGPGDYATWEYTYTLLTRAGFEVDRHGVAAGTIVNDQLCAVITATTTQRWKSEEAKLRELTSSFAVYPVDKKKLQQVSELTS